MVFVIVWLAVQLLFKFVKDKLFFGIHDPIIIWTITASQIFFAAGPLIAIFFFIYTDIKIMFLRTREEVLRAREELERRDEERK